ncbi:MAG TPA: O-antigen ligase family protein [Pseudolysinimonas sp.]|nr:O-antigen ligase family protein [Pseudolysinimonas sp.]
MPEPVGWGPLLRGIGGSPRVAQALTTVGIGIAATTFPLQRLIGWAGLIAALTTLITLMALSFVARRDQVEWRGILPISLLAYLAWALVSLVWSEYQWATAGGLAYLAAFTLIALYIALTRDTIQIVRAFGDVLRFVLLASLVLEVFSGILIDAPIEFLGIGGHLASGGPISGLLATRNQLGLVAIIAAVSFATEFRTRSVPRLVSVLSLVLAGLSILFTLSSIIFAAALMVGIAAGALYGLRRVRPERRQLWQLIVLGLAVAGIIAAWAVRSTLIQLFNADGVLGYRLELWNKVFDLARLNGLEGWGWTGRWHAEIAPFFALTTSADRPAQTALNAFFDVWLQLGIIGLVIFIGMVGLAFVRSWLLAGWRRSVVYAWPAIVLVALIVVSLAESSILVEFGWVTFVICCLKAAQELSWRRVFASPTPPGLDPRPSDR